MKQMSVGKMMTGGPKGKVVFSSSFELQNVLFIQCGVQQTKVLFHGVLDTKSNLVMCAIQNHAFTVCCRLKILIFMDSKGLEQQF